MRTVVTSLVVVLATLDVASAQIGAPESRVLCEKVSKATDGHSRIKKQSFTVSLATNGLTCTVKTPPKSRCFSTTVLAIDPPPPNLIPGVTTPTNAFNCYAMKCPPGDESAAAPDDFTANGQLLQAKSPNLYCTPVLPGE
jgi:hypothetical protein